MGKQATACAEAAVPWGRSIVSTRETAALPVAEPSIRVMENSGRNIFPQQEGRALLPQEHPAQTAQED